MKPERRQTLDSPPDERPSAAKRPAVGRSARVAQSSLGEAVKVADRALSRQAAQCSARGSSPSERALINTFAEAQAAEEAGASRQARRLLAVLALTGRSDGEQQAELMFRLLRGRPRPPAGNIAATMMLAHARGARARRRVKSKSRSAGGRRWSKGLHPGLWSNGDESSNEVPVFRTAGRPPKAPSTALGVIAVR